MGPRPPDFLSDIERERKQQSTCSCNDPAEEQEASYTTQSARDLCPTVRQATKRCGPSLQSKQMADGMDRKPDSNGLDTAEDEEGH